VTNYVNTAKIVTAIVRNTSTKTLINRKYTGVIIYPTTHTEI